MPPFNLGRSLLGVRSNIFASARAFTASKPTFAFLQHQHRSYSNPAISAATMVRADTSGRLLQLRTVMKDAGVDAYVIPSGDNHMSEYIAPCDGRREYISGFTGSAGIAVVTANKAALGTDGRYFVQAEKELDENWELLKLGMKGTLSWPEWVVKEVKDNQFKAVGIDPRLIGNDRFRAIQKKLKEVGADFRTIDDNLVDKIWKDRPPAPHNPIVIHPFEYSGQNVSGKLEKLREVITEKKARGFAVTALDEVAWLFNLRGSDIPFNPVFFAYAIVFPESVTLYVDEARISDEIKQHLGAHVAIRSYQLFYDDLQANAASVAEKQDALPMLVSDECSVKLECALGGESKIKITQSPIADAKAIKNDTEVKGMVASHARDGVAVIRYLAWLEDQLVTKKATIDEVDGADQLEKFRSEQEHFKGLSFEAISSSGPNAAIIHYSPARGDCAQIDPSKVYLLDSGGHYLDGTTDTTRTVHFGTPTDKEREAYTLVLKGHISVARAIFPRGTGGASFETLARQPLWRAGWDFRHSTGHGVGSYLCVHEGPIGISCGGAGRIPLVKGHVLSNEPGFYEDGEFGIRIESIVVVEDAKTKYSWGDMNFLQFQTVTMVPMCRSLIDPSLLDKDEIEWLNEYHRAIAEKTSPSLEKDELALAYLKRETAPF